MEWVKLGLHQDISRYPHTLPTTWIILDLFIGSLFDVHQKPHELRWSKCWKTQVPRVAPHHFSMRAMRVSFASPNPQVQKPTLLLFYSVFRPIPISHTQIYIYIFIYLCIWIQSVYTQYPMIFPQMLKTHFSPKAPANFFGGHGRSEEEPGGRNRLGGWLHSYPQGATADQGQLRWKSRKSHHGWPSGNLT